MSYATDQEALDSIIGRLEGRTIVSSGLDRGGDGFHVWLDDGNVLIFTGHFLIGIHRPIEDQTLQ